MKYLAYLTLNIGIIGTIISVLMFLIHSYIYEFTLYSGWGVWGNLLLAAIVILVYRYISGCFRASSLKGMAWSVGLSIVSSIFMIYMGVHNTDSDASASIWLYLTPTIIAAIYGIWAYNWVDDIISSDYAENITAEGLIGSVIDNGFKNTFNGILGDVEANMYASASHGVFVYSNTSFIISLLIMMIKW